MPRPRPARSLSPRMRGVRGFTYDAITGDEIYVPDGEPSEIGYDEIQDEQEPQWHNSAPDFPVEDYSGDVSPSMLDRFTEASNLFQNAYAQFVALGVPADDPSYFEYVRIAEWSETVKGTMDTIAAGIAGGIDAAKSAFGLSQVRRSVRGMGKLGVLPLLGIAAIGGAVAVIIAATNSMMQFIVNWRRAVANLEPVPGTDTGGGIVEGIESASNLVKWGVFGVVAWFALPEILKMVKK